MSEPVKLVVFVSGGVVQDILTCGIACEVALVDYDVDGDDEAVNVPDPVGGDDRARVSHWIINGQAVEETAYANRVFEIAEKAGDAP